MPTLLQSIFTGRMLIVLLMGFSSGLPLLLVGGTLKAWLRTEGVDLTLIGIFALVQIPYTLKFLWAPLLDRYVPPFLGRRRGWLLMTQIALMLGLGLMAFSNPTGSLKVLAGMALLIAFLSATQDIAIDAYRREILPDPELGLGNSLAVNGYRVAIWVSNAGALIVAGLFSWKIAYLVMASFLIVGLVTTLFSPEPGEGKIVPPRSLKEAVINPFRDYFSNKGAWAFLAFILLYKMGDQMASEMLNPFYLDVGFSLTQIGAVAKTVGIIAVMVGALVGGILMLRLGIIRSLWIFGILQAVSTLCFWFLAQAGPDLLLLGFVVAFENFTGGMGTAAYVSFMQSLTNRSFTGTQYALLSSLMGVPRVIAAAPTGYLAKQFGWGGFFIFCTLVAIPGLILLIKVVTPLRKES